MIQDGKFIYFQVIPEFAILFDEVVSLSYYLSIVFSFSRDTDRIHSYHGSQYHIRAVPAVFSI